MITDELPDLLNRRHVGREDLIAGEERDVLLCPLLNCRDAPAFTAIRTGRFIWLLVGGALVEDRFLKKRHTRILLRCFFRHGVPLRCAL